MHEEILVWISCAIDLRFVSHKPKLFQNLFVTSPPHRLQLGSDRQGEWLQQGGRDIHRPRHWSLRLPFFGVGN